jgi:DNA-binding CsgD family transcriptional regulator
MLAWQEEGASDAIARMQDAAARILAMGAEPFAALVFVDLVEVATDSGNDGAANEAADQLEALARRIDHRLYWALAEMGSARREDADAARRAVDLFATTGCRAFQARALDLLGRCLLETDRAGAVEALKRAAAAFEACGAVWRADRVRETLRGLGSRGRRAATAGLGPSALSAREREVARSAAEGLSAREIAERLFIGERTVETHLANVYTKLGVRSKVELARRASELGLIQ